MKRYWLGFIMALIAVGTFVLPVYALTAPASMSIVSVKAFRNVSETGDMAFVLHYNIAYGTYPTTTPASQSFLFRLCGTDGTTLLATSTPYVFSSFATYGYGNGVSCFYFQKGKAPAWEGAYKVNIYGLPAYFATSQTMTYTMITADYSSAELQADSRADMYNRMIELCDTFKEIYPSVSLKTTTDSGAVFSTYGESYFRGAIPGIQAMCPQLFFVQTYIPERIATDNYTMSLQTTSTARLTGSDIERGATRMGKYIGNISAGFMYVIFSFLICIGICIFTMRKGWGIEPGLLGSAGIGVLAAVLVGDLMFTLTMIGGLVAGMGIMFVFFFKRA